MMREPVGGLYAKAIYELAKESNQVDAVLVELVDFDKFLQEQPELLRALTSYTFSAEEKVKVAKDVLAKVQASSLVARLIELLTEKNRIVVLSSLCASLQDLVDASKNVVRGTVTTATNLNDSELTDLMKAFSKKLGKQVVLAAKVDKEVLGGLIVNVQGQTFDGSLKTTIRRLRETLERQSV